MCFKLAKNVINLDNWLLETLNDAEYFAYQYPQRAFRRIAFRVLAGDGLYEESSTVEFPTDFWVDHNSSNSLGPVNNFNVKARVFGFCNEFAHEEACNRS